MNNTTTLKTSRRLHILVPVESIHGMYSVVLGLRRGTRIIVQNACAVFLPLNRG